MKPQYVKYQPQSSGAGRKGHVEQRIVRIVEQQVDPLAPSKFRNKKAPPAPSEPPAPILRSPPRKLTKEDQQIWKIPPCVSNWKNAKGYVIPLDKRIGADGRGLQDVTVNERFAGLAEDLYIAEKKAREEIKIRSDLSKQQKARVEEQREQELRELAQQARMQRSTATTSHKSEEEDLHDRARREMMRETLREHRMAKAGKNARDRDEDRDVSEAIALGRQVQPNTKAAGDSMYDARLFNQDSGGLSSGFGEEVNAYDSRLFADRTSTAGYKYDARRVGQAREAMDDTETLAKERKRPVLGRDQVTGEGRTELQFVTENGDDEPDLFQKRPRH